MKLFVGFVESLERYTLEMGMKKNCCSNKNVRMYFVVWICWYCIGWNKAFYYVNALL